MYRSLGGGGFAENSTVDGAWPRGIQSPVRGRHGFKMELDLTDWSDRRAWFFGQYYQRDLIVLLENCLMPGDEYVDIGANLGMTCLAAAQFIGVQGKGLAYEPNPEAFSRLVRHMQINRIRNFHVENAGVSERNGSMTLFVGKHLGKASLISTENCLESSEGIEVKVVTGEHVLSRLSPASRVFVKIDVEGYEMHVLKSLDELWERNEIAVVVEVTHERLLEVGSSAKELYEFMQTAGFEPFLFRVVCGRFSTHLELISANPASPSLSQHDAIFVKRGSSYINRFKPMIKG